MLLPAPITTAPQIVHEIKLQRPYKKGLCAPSINLGANMRYDIFLNAVSTDQVAEVCLSDNQKTATILMKDGDEESIIFPENYDIVSYILQNDIPIEIQKYYSRPAFTDIISVIAQIMFIRALSQIFYSNANNKGKYLQDILFQMIKTTTYVNSYDLNNLMQLAYNFKPNEEFNQIRRTVYCKLYVKQRKLRRIFDIKNTPLK